MRHRGIILILMGGVYILCASAQVSFALVYSGGLDHITAPSADPGWDNVGKMMIGSGTYLGDGWVIAPYHVCERDPVGASHIDLDQRYYEIPGTARRIEYSSTVDADLVMFRIAGDPGLPSVEISSSAPLADEVTIIANGRSRVGDLVNFGGGYKGFRTTSTRAKRWGRNVTGGYVTVQSSIFGRTRALMTYFDTPGLGDDECQPVANDSGGSVFVESSQGGSWSLAGMALAVGTPGGYTGPNVTTHAVYGNHAYYADLSSYKDQIDEIRLIPLPGDADWDGDVDDIDIMIFQATFGQTGPDLQADFNRDELVNLQDFAIIRMHFGMVSGDGLPGAENLPVIIVPEPGTMILLAGGLPLLLKRKRKAR
ncbi:MAG: PEP-CTERM sorting domain-containing protein [Phycisphaerae bacterium]|nr:PEP-CTERM sorting domain-containing protein [Phycisphaerae bacterium]